MERFTSEVLPSGLKVEGNGNNFTLSFGETKLFLSRLDIARMYGIANPEKRHGSCSVDPEREINEKRMNRIHEYQQDPAHVYYRDRLSGILQRTAQPGVAYPKDIRDKIQLIPHLESQVLIKEIVAEHRGYFLGKYPDVCITTEPDNTLYEKK